MPSTLELTAAADRAARAIPPVWPLASSVAVNPFLGQTDETLATVAARLARVAGVAVTMPRQWYLDQMASGAITDEHLSEALAIAPPGLRPASLAALKSAAQLAKPMARALPTIADLAAEVSGIDWPALIAERFGSWGAGYFDEGQALWIAPRGRGAYAAWRAVATHDLTPEIVGLAGFATHVSEAPETASGAIATVVQHIAIPTQALETYFLQMLMTLGGWSQYARYRL
ncbi:MAG: Na-translocating system protein MpsB, partial [Caulobacteraceae bacterium]|nr:Na-translocating system protein MpsB [Caulobacteraceae bacterium]